jgi:hypothetical protein
MILINNLNICLENYQDIYRLERMYLWNEVNISGQDTLIDVLLAEDEK